MNHLKNFSFSALVVIFLSVFIIFNANTSLDVLAFLLIGFIILQKISGEYFILILLTLRPMLDYWRDYNIFSIRFADFNINAALSVFLLCWSILFFSQNFNYFKKVPLKVSWILFIIWCAASALYTYHLPSTITEVLKLTNLFGLFGICYIMSEKYGKSFQKNFLAAVIASACIPIAMGAYQLFTKTGMTIDEISNRIYGTFAHPNVLATFALVLLMVIVNELVKKKTAPEEEPFWLKIFAVILLGVIAFTYTRIAWIGAIILFLAVGLKYYKKMVLYTAGAIVLFYAVFYPLNRYLISNYNINLQSNSILARLTSRNPDSDSINWRTEVVSKAISLFRKKYLIGYGYGTFPRVWDDNKDIQNIWDNTSEAHDDYIKVALESGIIGLALFLLIFASMLYKQVRIGLKTHFHNLIFITSLIIYLVLSLSDNMLHHTPVIWWLWAIWGVWSYKTKNHPERVA